MPSKVHTCIIQTRLDARIVAIALAHYEDHDIRLPTRSALLSRIVHDFVASIHEPRPFPDTTRALRFIESRLGSSITQDRVAGGVIRQTQAESEDPIEVPFDVEKRLEEVKSKLEEEDCD